MQIGSEDMKLHAPWLPKGEFIIREAVAQSPTAPTTAKLTLQSLGGSDSYSGVYPIFEGNVEELCGSLLEKMVVGEQGETLPVGCEDDALQTAPDGPVKFWHSVLMQHGHTLSVTAYYYTAEKQVRSATFLLGIARVPHARKMTKAISAFFSNNENFQSFLKAREWLKMQIETRLGTMWVKSDVGAVNSGAVLVLQEFDQALALACLERNTFNRSVDTSHIGRLMIEVEQGNWTRGSENICFDLDGHLIDGQHRCSAVILGGKPVITSLAFGHGKDDVKHMNVGGKARSASDNYDIIQRHQIALNEVEAGDLDLRPLPSGREFKMIAGKFIYLETNSFKFNTPALQDAFLVENYEGLVAIKQYAHLLTAKHERVGSKGNLADPMILACFLASFKKAPNETLAALSALANNTGLGDVGTPLHTLGEVITSYTNEKPMSKNPSDLPLSKNIFICLFHYIHQNDTLTVKGLEALRKATAKKTVALVKTMTDFFMTTLPDNHPLRDARPPVTHSFLPTAVDSWREAAEKPAAVSRK